MTDAGPADLALLLGLGRRADDPRAARAAAALRALPRRRYRSALELGCGDGWLARRVAPRCGAYAGLDAAPEALAAARAAVPAGRFVEGALPCDLPPAPGGAGHDLVLLTGVLRALDPAAIRDLAARLDDAHPGADVVAAVPRGGTGPGRRGDAAFAAFANATLRNWRTACLTDAFRVCVFAPLRRDAR